MHWSVAAATRSVMGGKTHDKTQIVECKRFFEPGFWSVQPVLEQEITEITEITGGAFFVMKYKK